jgi:hypothetical protein
MSEADFASYSERTGWAPAFEVRYRYLNEEEGGRKSPPRQHVRWDFLYEGDDPFKDGISMVWPEFVSEEGLVLPEGEVPTSGRARMFNVNPERHAFHRARVSIGVRGFFMEGSRRVAHCEVTSVLGLAASAA